MPSSQPLGLTRPAPDSTNVQVVDTFSAGKEFFSKLVSSVDPQKLLPIAALAATLGLGTAAFYLSQRNDSKQNLLDPSPVTKSTNKSKSKNVKKRSTKSTRVAFQNAKENRNEGESTENNASDARSAESVGVPELPLNKKGDKETSALSPKIETQAQSNVLILKQCPRGRKTPCIAPFPLKLETFLRVHNLKYQLDFNGHEPRLYGSPWIRYNTEDITDSQNVLQFLMDQYNLQVEQNLTPEQRSMATAYTHLLENHLYWGIALWRWVYDGARSLKNIQLLPKKTQELIPDVCKTVEQAAWFHGIGKMTPEEVKRAVLKDLHSLSEFLGNKEYFLNTPIPTELDCTAFGMLSQFLWNMHGPFHEAITKDFSNLRDFCWRMRVNYWKDWEDCLNNTQFYSDEEYPTADSVNYPY